VRPHQLKVMGLATALEALSHDPKLHHKAAELGEKIRLEQGVENAVRLIEETFIASGVK
jgi:hypothetical protein